MTEFQETKLLAEYIVNKPDAAPCGSEVRLARQFLLSCNRVDSLRQAIATAISTIGLLGTPDLNVERRILRDLIDKLHAKWKNEEPL